jgi:hypothetical protein
MDLPDEHASFVLADAEGRVRMTRAQVEEHPDDTALKQVLVSAELAAGYHDRAARLAEAMELAAPHEVDTLLAISAVALADADRKTLRPASNRSSKPSPEIRWRE